MKKLILGSYKLSSICLILFVFFLLGCNQTSLANKATCASFNHSILSGNEMDNLIEVKPSEIPKFHFNNVKLTDSQRKLTANAAREVVRVVAGLQKMQENSPILGKGEYSSPKNPDDDIGNFLYNSSSRSQHSGAAIEIDNSYPFQELSAYFAGLSDDGAWCFGGIEFLRDRAYHTEFDERFFSDFLNLQLLDIKINKIHVNKDLPDDVDVYIKYPDIHEYAEYRYRLRDASNVIISFYVHFSDYNPKERYPRNFHNMEVRRGTIEMAWNVHSAIVKVGESCPTTGMWYCQGVSPEQGIYMRKGDPMPGQSYSKEQRETMEWRLIKSMGEV